MQYKIQKNSFGEVSAITIIGQNISIPMDEQNSDYVEYLKYIAEGGVVLPADQQGEQA